MIRYDGKSIDSQSHKSYTKPLPTIVQKSSELLIYKAESLAWKFSFLKSKFIGIILFLRTKRFGVLIRSFQKKALVFFCVQPKCNCDYFFSAKVAKSWDCQLKSVNRILFRLLSVFAFSVLTKNLSCTTVGNTVYNPCFNQTSIKNLYI